MKKGKPKATRPAAAKPVKKSDAKVKSEKVVVTGSLIPQKLSRMSGPLATASQVYVIDAEQIRRSGAVGVGGVLSRYRMNR